jgi:hypothetical protein
VRRFYEASRQALSAEALREVRDLFSARAQFDGPERPIGIRILRSGSKIFVDLADAQWRAIEITHCGWEVVSGPAVTFIRLRGMMALPAPGRDGKIAELRKFLNVSEEQWILLVAWLVGAFHPEGPYPVLILQGEFGSGKSTVARMLRLLVDPSTVPLRSVPRDDRDLLIQANSSWVIAIDNLSGLAQWLSDAFCRLSTGGGFGTRQLYTDDEEILFDAKRPIILNGIEDIARSGDLADRSLLVTIPPIADTDRSPEQTLWKKFEEAQPRILGALLDVVATAHRNYDQTTLERLPRMADFARWIAAAAPALPFTTDQFMEAYAMNRRDSVALSIESSQVATAVRLLVNAAAWVGSFTELLDCLNSRVPESVQRLKVWPKNARALSSALRRLAPLLRTQGIEIQELERDPKTKVKQLRIEKTP